MELIEAFEIFFVTSYFGAFGSNVFFKIAYRYLTLEIGYNSAINEVLVLYNYYSVR